MRPTGRKQSNIVPTEHHFEHFGKIPVLDVGAYDRLRSPAAKKRLDAKLMRAVQYSVPTQLLHELYAKLYAKHDDLEVPLAGSVSIPTICDAVPVVVSLRELLMIALPCWNEFAVLRHQQCGTVSSSIHVYRRREHVV
jgi:hypothetical protein